MTSVLSLILFIASFAAAPLWGWAKDWLAQQAVLAAMPFVAQAAAVASLGASFLVASALSPLLVPVAQGRMARAVLWFGSTFACIRVGGASQRPASAVDAYQSPVLLDIAGYYLALFVVVALIGWAGRRVLALAGRRA